MTENKSFASTKNKIIPIKALLDCFNCWSGWITSDGKTTKSIF
jgi:hypothetical protein